jgi:hypothetical protein
MERVSFLVEATGVRIPCLLNPESVVVRRAGAVRYATSGGTPVTGTGLLDDPILVTGGGRTELELDLLFDVSLVPPALSAVAGTGPSQQVVADVRDLTLPLWRLAENTATGGRGSRAGTDGTYGGPPLVRFVWGKAWNVPGVIARIAERLERFAPDGSPQRSWVRLLLLRSGEVTLPPAPPPLAPDVLSDAGEAAVTGPGSTPLAGAPGARVIEVVATSGSGRRLDDIAAEVYEGRAWMWRYLAAANAIANPPWVPAGTRLVVPPRPLVRQGNESVGAV